MIVGFIGVGHMGSELLNAVKDAGVETIVCEHRENPTATAAQVAGKADVLVLGVKPQDMASALSEIKDAIRDNQLIVSMAAGTTIKTIRDELGTNAAILRIMPNTPVAVGEGVIAWSLEGENEFVEPFLASLKNAGLTLRVDEDDMDGITALAGSGPAFVYRFINAMARGGEAAGLGKKESIELATQTCLGAAKLLQTSGKTPDELCDQVCSPGGTTIAGVDYLDSTNFEDDVIATVVKSFVRSCELSEG